MRSDCKNRQGENCDQRRVALHSTVKDTPKASRKKKSGHSVLEKIKRADGKNDREGVKIPLKVQLLDKRPKAPYQNPPEKLEGGLRYTAMASPGVPSCSKATYKKESIFPA